MMNFRLGVIVALAMLFYAAAGMADWQAGVARQIITPRQPMWMSGYASRNHAAEGKLHDLWAKTLVLQDDSGRKLILITLDLVGIGRQLSKEICARLQREHRVERSQIAICTSHTHTGPVVGRNLQTMYFLDEAEQQKVSRYADFLVDSVSRSVTAAMQDREVATLEIGTGTTDFAVNRRNNREADVPKLRAAGMLAGPVDHAVPVLSITNADGVLKAVVCGYACHATVLSSYDWSGDWPGFAQIEIERRHPSAIAMFVAGCGADQNPLPRRTVELAASYGRKMADAVDAVLAAEMQTVSDSACDTYEEIPLKFSTLPTRDEIQQDLKSSNKFVASRAANLLKQWDEQGSLNPVYPHYPVQTWNLGGESTVVFLGGEVVVDYGLGVRNEFPDQAVWVAAYSNDVMAYIPSTRVLNEGGYEGHTSMIYYGLPTDWDESIEDAIIDTIGQQIQQQRAKADRE